ncbi:MAG: hypothetical protein KC506_01110 [Nanoarchaeota archaeon]|nr:hypothetical protein [Nanoarchaeota archaeon]
MAVDVKKLIGAISPDTFCSGRVLDPGESDNKKDKTVKDMVKRIAKEEGYIKASEKVELVDSNVIDIQKIQFSKGAFSLEGLKNPIEQHSLIYDSSSQNLEPVYFWLLDFMNGVYGKTTKLIDNFRSSAGSAHFAEMGGRVGTMQDRAMSMFQTSGVILKSILNLVYDLKEFGIRLEQYKRLKSDNKNERDAAKFSLKQIWMDRVDINRGNGSINVLAQQLDFVTLRDAFLKVDLEKIDQVDLNERVKRILSQRLQEFSLWIAESERELKKRYEIEKTYLRSQVNSVRLYAKWAGPYLKAAQQLAQNGSDDDAALVNAFNTTLMELVVLAEGRYNPDDDVASGDLPKVFLKNKKLRKYVPIGVVEYKFRTIPDRTGQPGGGYTFRGKVDVLFTSFALNSDEIKKLKEEVAKDDFGDVWAMMEGMTTESLDQLRADLNNLLGEEIIKEDKKKEEKKSNDINPFSALFSGIGDVFKRKEKKNGDGIAKDSDYEKVLRSQAALAARLNCRKMFATYKKVHGMPALPNSEFIA